MEFEKRLVESGMENTGEIRKAVFYQKESRSEVHSGWKEAYVLVFGQENETNFVKSTDCDIALEIEMKKEPGLCESSISEIVSDNETLESDETEVEIKEEPWWLERTPEKKCDWNYSCLDAVEQNEIKGKINEFVSRKESDSSQSTQRHIKYVTTSAQNQSKQEADERVQETIYRRPTVISHADEKDEWSVFGQFVASKLRSLQRAPKLQIKLKNLINKSIVKVSTEYAEKLSNAVPPGLQQNAKK